MNKIVLSAQDLLEDSFRLGLRVLEDGFKPTMIIAIWRGGTPVGMAVQEIMAYCGVESDHIAIRTSSYVGVDERGAVAVHGLNYIIKKICHDDRVLIVDDDLSVLEGTGRLLRQWGCNERLARSVEEAVECCGNGAHRPDAMLADYRLGDGTTGLDAIRRLNDLFEQPVPAAVVTGETTRDVLDEIRASGLVHLKKPVAPFKLRATLMELLRS